MRAAFIKTSILFLAILVLFVQPCWAKAQGFCYIVSYSYVEKTAYFSPIIMQKVDSKSYSNEEYVTDVELIQKLESQFITRLSRNVNLDAGRYTVTARGAYKTNAIANEKARSEMEQYKTKGYSVKVVRDFVFSD